MKYLIGAAVVFLVFLLPAGSYLYLHYGLEYRKTALSELDQSEAIHSDVDTSGWGLDGRISVLYNFDLNKSLSDSNLLTEQFNNNPNFQILSVSSSDDGLVDTEVIKHVAVTDGQKRLLFDEDEVYALCDTFAMLRRSYGADIDELKLLVKHVGIILPQETRYQKVRMKPKQIEDEQ